MRRRCAALANASFVGFILILWFTIDEKVAVFGDLSWGPKVGLVLLTSIPLFFAYLPLASALQQQCNKKAMLDGISKALRRPNAPLVSPDAPTTHYVFKTEGILQERFQQFQHVADSKRAERERRILVREPLHHLPETSDAWIHIALNEANKTRGLDFLPRVAKNVIHLRLAIDLLVSSNASGPTIRGLREKLGKLEKNHFAGPLFDVDFLAKVDCTPNKENTNYFVKYLQPLMVAFDEKDFEESAGITNADAARVLTEHLRLLVKRRVRAARIDAKDTQPIISALRDTLPRQMPKPGARGAQEVREFNRDKAARSMLVVATRKHREAARQIEFAVESDGRFREASPPFAEWTPRLDQDTEHYCFFWQQS